MTNTQIYSGRVKEFCKKYFARILDDNKRCAKHIAPRHMSYSEPGNDGRDLYQQTMMTYETEPVIVIEIPLSKLESLIQQENLFFNNVDAVHQRRIFEEWMEDRQSEKNLRARHPGVQETWEKYKMMVELCRQDSNKIKGLED